MEGEREGGGGGDTQQRDRGQELNPGQLGSLVTWDTLPTELNGTQCLLFKLILQIKKIQNADQSRAHEVKGFIWNKW